MKDLKYILVAMLLVPAFYIGISFMAVLRGIVGGSPKYEPCFQFDTFSDCFELIILPGATSASIFLIFAVFAAVLIGGRFYIRSKGPDLKL